ncbi:MAG: hypothetical protein K2O34_15230 [Acetatifactor sp.]|nr:hypothetical protein [Acetatifactor sp.]
MKDRVKIKAVICACLYACWWGLLCPEVLVNPDTCRVVNEETGEEILEQAGRLYQALLEADRDQVRYRSRLLELLEQLLEKR